MIQYLISHGKDLALVLDRSVLELLDINEETPLAVTIEDGRLVISPVSERQRKFLETLEDGNRKYGNMLKRLAEEDG